MTKREYFITFMCSLGGMLEFYDFFIFLMFAEIIGKTFLAEQSTTMTTLIALIILATGYMGRPVGGIVFGYLGDRFGRKKTFNLTLLIMAFSTLGIAALPSYMSIGFLAPILLVVFRIGQGLAVGGDIPGAMVYIHESVGNNKLPAYGMFIGLISIGILGAQIVHYVIGLIGGAESWRIAFVIGGLLIVVSRYIRKYLRETPEFLALKSKDPPYKTLVKKHLFSLVVAFMIPAFFLALLTIFLLSFGLYLTGMKGYGQIEIRNLSFLGTAVIIVFPIIWGCLIRLHSTPNRNS